MIKTDLLTCHQDLVRGGCYYTLLTQTLIQLFVQVFYYYCTFVHTFLQAPVYWCAYESCFVVLVQASTISIAWVSGWTVTDYLFADGWRLFKHLLLSAAESEAVHFISLFNFTVV